MISEVMSMSCLLLSSALLLPVRKSGPALKTSITSMFFDSSPVQSHTSCSVSLYACGLRTNKKGKLQSSCAVGLIPPSPPVLYK